MIENQVAQGSYREIDGFLHDLNRMLSNHMHFFQKESQEYAMALVLQNYLAKLLKLVGITVVETGIASTH
jgi:hypothetical protein